MRPFSCRERLSRLVNRLRDELAQQIGLGARLVAHGGQAGHGGIGHRVLLSLRDSEGLEEDDPGGRRRRATTAVAVEGDALYAALAPSQHPGKAYALPKTSPYTTSADATPDPLEDSV